MDSFNLPEGAELVDIEVGKEFPLFKEGLARHIGQEYAVFEANDFGQGYMFMYYMSDATPYEIESFRKSPIEMRIILGSDNMVIPLIKIGQDFICEIIFDPTAYNDDRALQFIQTNNILTLCLIDSTTGTLLALRQSNLPLQMIKLCKESWSRALLDVHFSSNFSAWYKQLQAKYFLDEMWDRAVGVGKMGETYNIKELSIPTTRKTT